jgi:pimeloyl-ACP methyl ester carboxylesterase
VTRRRTLGRARARRSPWRTPLAAGALVAALTLGAAAPAGAALPGEAPCSGDAGLQCSTLTVPLDRSGALPGAVSLAVRRLPAAGAAVPRVAIVGLAGGPGQAAAGLTRDFAEILRPGLGDHDLVAFDPRGAGGSGALRCAALNAATTTLRTPGECARQLGPRRGHYTTEDSVGDLEAIRQAGGYDRLTLFAVSYGTKVALRYAARYPDRVERLVLDSVLPADGPDPFMLSSFDAMRRILPALCAGRRCSGITSRPTSELTRLRRRMVIHDLRTTFLDGRGRRRKVSLGALDLLSLVRAGDMNPTLRADLPAAVHSALRHDGAPLARLAARAAGADGTLAGGARLGRLLRHASGTGASAAAEPPPPVADVGGVDAALFFATTCEEAPLPWDRAADPATRLDQAIAATSAIVPSRVLPFDRVSALLGGLVPLCLTWPDAAAAPPPAGTPPAVPTLLLEGADDVRTPVEDAQAVAATIPGSRLLVVPHTGHSVLGSDLTNCSRAAVAAFLAGGAVADCVPAADRFPPTRVAPRSLTGLRPTAGVPGRPGRTLRAVRLTLADAYQALLAHAIGRGAAPRSGTTLGGLRAGSLRVTGAGVRLRGYSLVPGVALSGLLPKRGSAAHLRVTGAAAAAGTLTVRRGGSVRGVLDGRRVHAASAAAALARPLPGTLFRTPRLAGIR